LFEHRDNDILRIFTRMKPAKNTLTPEIKKYIGQSVLCWLATVSADLIPNVSPKEIFHYFEADKIIIANIASPQSVKNIAVNPQVCVSFLDVLVQKGFQVKGTARMVGEKQAGYDEMAAVLLKMTEGKFPFTTIIEITLQSAKPIIAPRYLFFPETTEEQQIESARKTYGV